MLPGPQRRFVVALAVWVLASILATSIVPADPLVGLAIGAAGGAAFGVLAARKEDPRRVKIRRRRRRATADAEGDSASAPEHETA